jgi:oligopeptide transport system ATP-binding protein
MPRLDQDDTQRLATIAGQPPNLQRLPAGCAFRDRCDKQMDICAREVPALEPFEPGRSKACHLATL